MRLQVQIVCNQMYCTVVSFPAVVPFNNTSHTGKDEYTMDFLSKNTPEINY